MPSHKLLISLFFLACFCLDPSRALAAEGTKNNAPEEDLHFILFWEGVDPLMKMSDLVAYCAPVFWLSPDEPELHNLQGKDIMIPAPFPFDESSDKPVVYYQVRKIVVSDDDKEDAFEIDETNRGDSILDLRKIYGFDMDYNHYYEFESGLGGHDHDTEQAQFKVFVQRVEGESGLTTY
jgi:hypothetical protein